MSEPTPPPWRFEDHVVTGPPLYHPHDPDGRVFPPATIVAHLPANFGGVFRYYPPEQRDANGRLIQAGHDMLQAIRDFARLPDDSPPLTIAQIAARCRAILSHHGFAPDLDGPIPSAEASADPSR